MPSLLLLRVYKSLLKHEKHGPWCPCSVPCLPLYPHLCFNKKQGGYHKRIILYRQSLMASNHSGHPNKCPFDIKSLLLSMKALLIHISSTCLSFCICLRGQHHVYAGSPVPDFSPVATDTSLVCTTFIQLSGGDIHVPYCLFHIICSPTPTPCSPANSLTTESWLLRHTCLFSSSLVPEFCQLTSHSLLSTLLEFGLLFCRLLSHQ